MNHPDPERHPAASNLTRNQLLIWLGQELHPASPLYNVIMTFRFAERIDPPAFQAAFDRLVREAEPLRTIFETDGGPPRRVVLPDPPEPCHVIDLAGSPESREAWVERHTGRQLELGRCPYHSALLRSGDSGSTWFLAIHHICTDSTSNSILVRRMAELYAMAVDGRDPGESTLPSFEALVDAERAGQSAARPEGAGEPGFTPTRFYRGRAGAEGTASWRGTRDLGSRLSRLLREQAGVPGTGLTTEIGIFNLLVTAVVSLLHRLEGRREVSVGVVTRNRPSETFKRTPGLFMEIVPVHVALSPGESFGSLLERVFSLTSAALITPPGSSSSAERKQCDVVINYQTNTFGDFGDIGMETKWVHTGHMDPHYRLCLHFEDYNQTGSYRLLADFASNTFTPEEGGRAMGHLLTTLEALLADRSRALSTYGLLDRMEEQELMELGGALGAAPPADANLYGMIHDAGRSHPDHPAVADGRRTVTYGELLDRADRWAAALRHEGVATGDVVAVEEGRSVEFVVAVLAVLRLGAAFLPVDPRLPEGRARGMVDESGTTCWIRARHRPPAAEEPGARPVAWPDLDRFAEPLDAGPPAGGGLAYILYTSGTTGEPKGVACTHRAVSHLLAEFERRAPLPRAARAAWWTTVGFDVMIYDLFSALCFGRTLCIPPDEIRPDPAQLVDWVDRERITSAYLPAGALSALRLATSGGRCRSLQRLLVGVEPIPQRLLSAIAGSSPGLTVLNGYGPTEATVCATLHAVDPGDDRDGPAPIGTPVPGSSIFILDGEGQLVPRGVPGELCIAGAGLADGYRNRPDLTRERFTTAGKLPGPARRIYRTGDLARWREDGQLEFLGRIDSQMKIRGHRIEPGEIIHCALELESVDRAAVRAWSDQVCLYLRNTGSVEEEAIRRHLASKLPYYMLPVYIVTVPAFPETASGKVDVEALPDPRGEAPGRVAPSGPVETALTGMFGDILGVARVGATDHFLQLGGDSLRGMQLMAQVGERFGTHVDLHQFFRLPTVRALAELVERTIRSEIEAMSEEEAQNELSR